MFPELAEAIRCQCEVDRWLTIPWEDAPGRAMATTVDYRTGEADEPAPNADQDQTDAGSPRPIPELPPDQDAPLREADFQLLRRLGAGGMGEVHEAIQRSLRKHVALKLIPREALDSPSRVRRFFTEARALARLRHPHIVGVHGIGRMADGRYFLVMDLVEGGTTLAALIKAGTVSFEHAASLVATVAEAIDHAHARGVIHRDLKPSNVLLDAEGSPHVTDFGLAKVFDAADPDNPPTTADQVLGTPHYMSPEQADPARGPITPRTDIYALGGLLYSLLTGRPPIQGDSLTALLTQVVSPEPVLTPRELRRDIPAALERICRTCLEKDANKRYASAGEVAAALRAWLAFPVVEEGPGGAAALGCLGHESQSADKASGAIVSQADLRPPAGKASGFRRDWIPDRSWKGKDGHRPPNSDRWEPKTAAAPRFRRRLLLAGTSVATLLLAVLVIVSGFDVRSSRHLDYALPAPVPTELSNMAGGEVAAKPDHAPPAPAPPPLAAPIIPAGIVLRLALSSNPSQLEDLPMDRLRLRPIAGARQPFFVFVKNPSPMVQNVVVEVREGDKVVGLSGHSHQPLLINGHSSMLVPSFGGPPSKPGEPLPELAGPLRLRLLLARTQEVLDEQARPAAIAVRTQEVLDEQTIPVAIAWPRDYIEVTEAEFAPAGSGRPNRLAISLRGRPQMTGPLCPVELVLSQDQELFPSLLGPPRIAKLAGELAPGKPPLTLYAEDIALDSKANVEGSFYLNVDGVKRAIWFRGRFPQVGGPQKIAVSDRARVRFQAERLVEPDTPARLRVAFAVDNAPAETRLVFHVGRVQGGKFVDDLEPWIVPAKRSHIGFDPRGEAGGLLFEATLHDWTWERPVPGLVGPRRLQAQLLDATGRTVLDTYEMELVFEDQRLRYLVIEVPDRIERGTRALSVRASATPPPSGIKEVVFFVGTKADFVKAEAVGQLIKGQPSDSQGRSWKAMLPIPKEASGKLAVTARFKSGAGMIGFCTAEVTVSEPPPNPPHLDRPLLALPTKPGAIEGTVKEGKLGQAGLSVYLIDPAAPKETPKVKMTKTNAEGAFSFKDLEPKTYRLFCQKETSQRKADLEVKVEAGRTVRAELDLRLP
jgi:serine/threonine protein kinase